MAVLILIHPVLIYNNVLLCMLESFLEDFCCGTKSKLFREPSPPPPSLSSCGLSQSDWNSCEPHRTDSQPGYGDPGGGGATGTDAGTVRFHPLQTQTLLELKQPSSTSSTSSHFQGNCSPFNSTATAQTHYQVSHHHHHHQSSQQPQYPPPSPPSPPDTDSALEAAVNSILEC